MDTSNVIDQLFGSTSFTHLTTNIEPEVHDLLWHLKGPLGNVAYAKIRRDPRPADALIHAMNDRKDDKLLANAFRGYVLNSTGLHHLLTSEAKLRAGEGREPRKLPEYPLSVRGYHAEQDPRHPSSPGGFADEPEPPWHHRSRAPLRIPPYSGIYHVIPTRDTLTAAPDALWLPQVSLHSFSKLYDTASRTIISQIFINPSQVASVSNAKYIFPLYESCAVVSFRCYVKGKLIEGVIKERGEAKAKYNEAVERGETAALLEQHTAEVFSASIGNIPAGEKVTVEIEYIVELKHDSGIDGIRFTIPTSVAPRYGSPPKDLDWNTSQGVAVKGGIDISVEITMAYDIESVSSPSHPISVHLGGHAEDVPQESPNLKRALAKLAQTSNDLGKDFVLLIKCADPFVPSALCEIHPTIPNSKALMVTLVPKFRLPESSEPEVVFVVDCSGSMKYRIPALKSALQISLKSLPLGIKFNICTFGYTYSFLWNKSQAYFVNTLAEAQRHVESLSADLGGTEISGPIVSAISKRDRNLNLEIMVYTDGEVWNREEVLQYVAEATVNGDVRVFSLGIGVDASHALVEGLARAGGGFAQMVLDEGEAMENKVVRMLRGALSPHIHDYQLDWEEKGRNEPEGGSLGSKLGRNPTPKRIGEHDTESPLFPAKISLFDTTTGVEPPISFPQPSDFKAPNVLQAPYKLPGVFPFSRYTVYAILSGEEAPPPSLHLHGTTPSGDKLELEIHVQLIPECDRTIHQLAARKALQELEEGLGYIQHEKYRVNKQSKQDIFDEWAAKEGLQVSLRYGLVSKWTCFLAVNRTKDDDAGGECQFKIEEIHPNYNVQQPQSLQSSPKILTRRPTSMSARHVRLSSDEGDNSSACLNRRFALPVMRRSPITRARFLSGSDYRDYPQRSYTEIESVRDKKVRALVALQMFEGSFTLGPALAGLVGSPLANLEAKLAEFVPMDAGLNGERKRSLWATVLAVRLLETKLSEDRDVWELVVSKAKAWIQWSSNGNMSGVSALERLADEVLHPTRKLEARKWKKLFSSIFSQKFL